MPLNITPCFFFGSVLSHGLPCFVHGLNMFLGFHPQSSNAEAALVNFLQGEFISKHRRALIWWGCHRLHTLVHDLRGVQEAMALISSLQALSRPHEVWNSMHWCSVGQRSRQPVVQGQWVTHGAHAGVHGRSAEGEHGRVMKLYGASVHLLLTPPFGTTVLEPHLD